MRILRDFERRLEGAVEGAVRARLPLRGQPGAGQAPGLGRSRTAARSGSNRVYVPNVYVYELSPATGSASPTTRWPSPRSWPRWPSTRPGRDWAMLGPARIEFETADDLEVGRFQLSSRVEADEQERDYAAAPPRRRARRSAPARRCCPASAPSQGGRPGQPGAGPGRPADPDLAAGPGGDLDRAGRAVRHPPGRPRRVPQPRPGGAQGDDFIVEDLRSTNGTEVNGQPIRRRRLANGDMLKLASSTLQFRREG